MVGHGARQDMIEGYGLRSTWAQLDAEDAAHRARFAREDAEDAEGRLARFHHLAQAHKHALTATLAGYMARVYADDQERHRAERDGREPRMNTLLQQRPPGSGLAWGELLRAHLFMTLLVAALFAALAAVEVLGGVGVALLWTPTQAAIMAGLWWAARRSP